MNEIMIIAPIAAIIVLGKIIAGMGAVSPLTFRETNKILYWISIPAMLLRLTAEADLGSSGNLNLLLSVHATYFILPFMPGAPENWRARNAADCRSRPLSP